MGQEQQNLHFWDFHRWMMGETPWWFLAEVAVRAVIVYLVLLITLRVMGRRVASQMTISELAIVVTLGAAVGVPMQDPKRGMLGAVAILIIAVIVERMLAWMSYHSRKAEVVTQGDVLTVVEDSRILLDGLKEAGLSRERLFSVLRREGIEHLGQVRRVYAEASGDFSVYLYRKARPGLSVLPTCDQKLRRSELSAKGYYVCDSCGELAKEEHSPTDACSQCGSKNWSEAVTEIKHTEEHPEATRGEENRA